MKPEIKSKWIEALRSGKYEQGIGLLRSPSNRFCCLGVLCDLYIKEHPEEGGWWKTQKGRFNFLDEFLALPKPVQEWAEIDRSGTLSGDDAGNSFNGPRTLADLNDNHYSFEEIAQIIETDKSFK